MASCGGTEIAPGTGDICYILIGTGEVINERLRAYNLHTHNSFDTVDITPSDVSIADSTVTAGNYAGTYPSVFVGSPIIDDFYFSGGLSIFTGLNEPECSKFINLLAGQSVEPAPGPVEGLINPIPSIGDSFRGGTVMGYGAKTQSWENYSHGYSNVADLPDSQRPMNYEHAHYSSILTWVQRRITKRAVIYYLLP